MSKVVDGEMGWQMCCGSAGSIHLGAGFDPRALIENLVSLCVTKTEVPPPCKAKGPADSYSSN